jgi:hypothetical protein
VAGGTCAGGYIAVIKYCRRPGIGAVTVIAGVVAGDVVRRLAGRRGIVMTAEAGPQHSGMVNPNHRDPGAGPVAILAQRRGLDMAAVLARGRGTIMAARAVATHRAVIERRRRPGIGAVTVIAGVVTGDVIGRLAGCRGVVMTAEAGPQHFGMIDLDRRQPGRSQMTCLANRRGPYMTSCPPCRKCAVVTAYAGDCHIAVIESRRGPCSGGVTVLTVVVSRNMIGSLSGRC